MQDPSKPKVLYALAGKPLVGHVLDLAKKVESSRTVVIVGFGKEKVIDEINSHYSGIEFAVQSEQLGTGHAMQQTADALNGFEGDILVLYGDVPLLTSSSVAGLLKAHRNSNAKATVLTAIFDDPTGYGRIVRTSDGKHLDRIVEERDASPEIKAIKEMNSGIYVFRAEELYPALAKLQPNNDQKEYYLTDVFRILIEQFGENAVALSTTNDPIEVSGVNTKEQLGELEAEYLRRERS